MSDSRVGISIIGTRVAGAVLSLSGDIWRIQNLATSRWDGKREEDLARALRELRRDLNCDVRACFLVVDETVALTDRWEDTDGKAAEAKRTDQAAYYHGRRVFRSLLTEDSTILVDPVEGGSVTSAILSLVQVPALSVRVRAARSAGWRPVAAYLEAQAYTLALRGMDAIVRFDGEQAAVIVVSLQIPQYSSVDVAELVEGQGSFDSARRLAARAGELLLTTRGQLHNIERIAIVGQRERFESFSSALIAEVERQQLEIAPASLAWLESSLPPIAVERYAGEVAAAVGAALCSEGEYTDVLRADTSQALAVVRETPHLRNGAMAVAAALLVAVTAHMLSDNALTYAKARMPVLQSRIDQDQAEAEYVDNVEQYAVTLGDIYTEVQKMRGTAHEHVLIASSVLNALPKWVAVSEIKTDPNGWELHGFVPDEGKYAALLDLLARINKPNAVLQVQDRGTQQKGKRTQFVISFEVAE